MNIIITLPSNLIQLIKEGRKTIELRKHYPLFFNKDKDVIYICKKGTACVVGYMKIDTVVVTQNKYDILTEWAKDIAVPREWIEKYIKDTKILYGYFIGEYKFFDKPLTLEDHYHVYQGPGTFLYTSINYR